MDNQPNAECQLDIKLLKWLCGDTKLQVRFPHWDTDKQNPEYLVGNSKRWRTHEIDVKAVPQFCMSLDLCFTLLAPKLDAVYLTTINNKTEAKIRKGLPLKEDSWWLAEHSNPATALCLAIEKVIDRKYHEENR